MNLFLKYFEVVTIKSAGPEKPVLQFWHRIYDWIPFFFNTVKRTYTSFITELPVHRIFFKELYVLFTRLIGMQGL